MWFGNHVLQSSIIKTHSIVSQMSIKDTTSTAWSMMTSSNGNIYRVTGHLCGESNSPVPGEFPAQRPVTRSFDVFFDIRLNKRLGKKSRGCWLETPSYPLWRHRNVSVSGVRSFRSIFYISISKHFIQYPRCSSNLYVSFGLITDLQRFNSKTTGFRNLKI